MLRSLFGRGKKKQSGKQPVDDSIRSARVGDVVFIPGLWETGEDAYLIVESIDQIESAYGGFRELSCVDGDRKATVEWSDSGRDGLHIFVSLQDRPMGLSSIGVDYDTLVAWDDFKSLENAIEHDGRRYSYRNSYEAFHHGHDEGFYTWEFARDDDGGAVTVVKWEGMPFEVYVSTAISPHVVTVYHK